MPDEKRVERLARAAWEFHHSDHGPKWTWELAPERGRENYRDMARAALAADPTERELAKTREALAEAAIPLEVLRGLGNTFRLRKLRRDYDKLISPSLRDQIVRSTDAARAALRSTEGDS